MVADAVIRIRLMSLLVLTTVAIGVWAGLFVSSEASVGQLEVAFLDVGQGDATLITTSAGAQVLVDGGPDSGVLRELAAVLPLFDTDLDMVVATHPDTDHVGGLVDVLERYDVRHIVMTENEGESAAARAYARAAATENAAVTMARRGQLWQLDASTTLEVLWPEADPTDMESNASSIVLKLAYGETCMILTGDAPKRVEEYLVLAEGEHLACDVLKIGHHGSRTSTAEIFLEEVNPAYAVISAELNSRYGHPHVEVTDLLFNQRVEVLETATEGTITFVSDGVDIFIK